MAKQQTTTKMDLIELFNDLESTNSTQVEQAKTILSENFINGNYYSKLFPFVLTYMYVQYRTIIKQYRSVVGRLSVYNITVIKSSDNYIFLEQNLFTTVY